MIKIIPSILTGDLEEFNTLLEVCEGVVDRVQIDVIDGVFAENKTVGPDVLENYTGNLKFDFHLMVKDPINWVAKSIRAGADRIIGQVEMMDSQVKFIEKVQEVGAKVGMAIDLDTPVSKIDPLILKDIDLVLVMSVPAGFGGQKFHPDSIGKIELLDKIRAKDDTPFIIQDDGGLTLEKIDDVHISGTDEVVIGRRLFEGDLADNIKKFEKAAHRLKI